VAPTIPSGAIGTLLTGAHVSGSANIDIPDGMVAGSLALVFVYTQSEDPVTATGTGMHELTPAPVTTTPNVTSLHVFWHVATGVELTGGTYGFTWTESQGSGGDYWRGGIAVRVDGADTTTPIDVYTSLAQETSAKPGPQVQVTPTGTDRLLIWAGSDYNGGNWPTPPSGYTAQVNNSDAIGVFSRAWPTQTASGLVRGTSANAGAQTGWLIAVNPLVVPTGPEPGRMLLAVS
jgi:hypothetical protein